MLVINKGEINYLVVSVSQHKTISNPYYLFSFEHIMSKEKVRFYAQNVSVYNNRYDEFRFIEGTPQNLTASTPTITFQYEGMYYYSVYEMASSGTTNPQFAVSKLEEGRAVIYDNCVPATYYQYDSGNENNENYIFISPGEQPDCPITFFILNEEGSIITAQNGNGIEYQH
jgi:hypothetical protein